jgi:hypothetical protein
MIGTGRGAMVIMACRAWHGRRTRRCARTSWNGNVETYITPFDAPRQEWYHLRILHSPSIPHFDTKGRSMLRPYRGLCPV